VVLIGILLALSASWCWSEGNSLEANPLLPGSAEPNPKITVSQDLITFSLASGQAGPVDAYASIRVVVQSSTFGWAINYLASPLTMTGTGGTDGPGGSGGAGGPGSFGGEVIMPNRLLIKTPYTNGFESLDMPRLVGKGDTIRELPTEVANLQFRYMAGGQEKPGTYEGDIYSPDLGPTVHVKLIVGPPGLPMKGAEGGAELGNSPLVGQAGAGSEAESGAGCGPKIRMSLSPEKVHFPVTGAPKEYDADNTVLLSVESKGTFMVKAHATPLESEDSDIPAIPAGRIFVNPGNGNYYSLENDVVVLERSSVEHCKKERTISTSLSFRLKAGWDDPAGEYSGTIVFTCMPEM